MQLTPDQIIKARGESARDARLARGLNQADVAGHVGVSISAISVFERSGLGLGDETMKNLAVVLGLTFSPSKPAEIGTPKES